MLKIKDNVDLEILKKYGFVYSENDKTFSKKVESLYASFEYNLEISINRSLSIELTHIYWCNDDDEEDYIPYAILLCLYDLIKDGLIEKVEDK